MDQGQSFDGRECEILFNPALLWTMQQFPNHTKGEVLFFMLPLEVRHMIYDYHSFHHASFPLLSMHQRRTADKLRTVPRRSVPPLAQTCRTFRREMQGLKGSRAAIFKDETDLRHYLCIVRKKALTPYVTAKVRIKMTTNGTSLQVREHHHPGSRCSALSNTLSRKFPVLLARRKQTTHQHQLGQHRCKHGSAARRSADQDFDARWHFRQILPP